MPKVDPPAPPAAARAVVVATQRWASAGMMARELHLAGLKVAAWCPRMHPMRRLKRLDRVWTMRPWRRLETLDRLLDAWSPTVLVPADDAAVDLLHAAYRRYRDRATPDSGRKLAILAVSLGAGEVAFASRRKSRVLEVAAGLGIDTPRSRVIASESQLREAAAMLGFPLVLKSDRLWGGLGVRICHDQLDASRALAAMRAPPAWLDVVKDCLRTSTLAPLLDRLRFATPTVSAQELVTGRPMNYGAVCWEGRALGGVTVEVVEQEANNGPATVVRLVDSPAVAAVAARLVAAMRLSGFCGFDFMVEAASGRHLLLEINPRVTSASYLSTSSGTSLPFPLSRRLHGAVPAGAAGPAVPGLTVALFPHELQRDPSSAHLSRAIHNVPWDEPDFVRACISAPARHDWLRRGGLRALRAWWRRASAPLQHRPAGSAPASG